MPDQRSIQKKSFSGFGTNYKSNLAVLRNFADVSSFSSSFGLFIALMTLLFILYSSSSSFHSFLPNYINKNKCDGEVFFYPKKTMNKNLYWKLCLNFRGNKYFYEKALNYQHLKALDSCWENYFDFENSFVDEINWKFMKMLTVGKVSKQNSRLTIRWVLFRQNCYKCVFDPFNRWNFASMTQC